MTRARLKGGILFGGEKIKKEEMCAVLEVR